MDFIPKNQNETLLLEMVKKLDEIEKNTHTKPQETLEFKMTKPKQTFHFSEDLIIPEKWLMGLSKFTSL